MMRSLAHRAARFILAESHRWHGTCNAEITKPARGGFLQVRPRNFVEGNTSCSYWTFRNLALPNSGYSN